MPTHQIMVSFRLMDLDSAPITFALDASTLQELEQFRVRCFWWVAPSVALLDLPRESLLRGLRVHGGRAGMRLAARLAAEPED